MMLTSVLFALELELLREGVGLALREVWCGFVLDIVGYGAGRGEVGFTKGEGHCEAANSSNATRSMLGETSLHFHPLLQP